MSPTEVDGLQLILFLCALVALIWAAVCLRALARDRESWRKREAERHYMLERAQLHIRKLERALEQQHNDLLHLQEDTRPSRPRVLREVSPAELAQVIQLEPRRPDDDER